VEELGAAPNTKVCKTNVSTCRFPHLYNSLSFYIRANLKTFCFYEEVSQKQFIYFLVYRDYHSQYFYYQNLMLMNDNLDISILNFQIYYLNNFHLYDGYVKELNLYSYLLYSIHILDMSYYVIQINIF
jgi:hypothetical protein